MPAERSNRKHRIILFLVAVVIAAGALALVLLGSWIDTWRTLRRRAMMGDWLARVTARSRGGSGQA